MIVETLVCIGAVLFAHDRVKGAEMDGKRIDRTNEKSKKNKEN